MATEEDVPPEPQLMESMRAVGYTLEAAIADLIDNSITAGAGRVDIHFASEPDDYVAILDDGRGMTADEARQGMRLAGKSPTSERSPHDLGRFGLGLKTASLSQCRDLVLVSKKDGETCSFQWNLDHLERTGTWSLIRLAEDEIKELPHSDQLDALSSGTLVLWRDLDQLRAQVGEGGTELDHAMAAVKEHLALVFHRFLAGDHGDDFTIAINYDELEEIDPFLTSHRSTLKAPAESFEVEGQRIDVQAFTLPLITKLTSADRKRALVAGRIRDSQGFYIYRAMRLVIWGTWFRILPKDDLAKLARVRVDVPNTLDHLWALDIKKAAALPPPEVKTRLKRVADRIIKPSRNVHLYRGRPEPQTDPVTRTWQLIEERGHFRYDVNRDHPLLATFEATLDAQGQRTLGEVLTLLESTYPAEDLFNRLGQDEVRATNPPDQSWILDRAVEIWEVWRHMDSDAERFIASMSSTEPFNQAVDSAALLREATRI